MMTETNYAKLHPCSLGLALGIVWGLAALLLGISSWLSDYGDGLVSSMGQLYIGYGPSLGGAIIGGIWGFVDAFICGFLVAWLYNCCQCCCQKRCCPKSEENSTKE